MQDSGCIYRVNVGHADEARRLKAAEERSKHTREKQM